MDDKYTKFENVYSKFLSSIDDYEFSNFPADDFEFQLEQLLSGAIGLELSGQLQKRIGDLDFDKKEFKVALTNQEEWIIAKAMAYRWLESKITTEDLMRTAVSDRDYTETSPANQLRALRAIKLELEFDIHKYDVEYSYYHNGFDGLS